MKKFLALTLFLLLFITAWSVAAFAAAATGYDPETGRIILPSEAGVDNINNNYYIRQQQIQQQNDLEEIRQAEARYQADQEAREEREKIRQWEKLDMEIKLRQYDKLVMGMEKEYHAAKQASNPFLGEQGYVIYPYGEVVPVITCRPLRMTDVALEPGEEIMGIHAGDTVRWQFSPSQSMKNGMAVAHIVVKPNQPGISTNLLVHTNKRTYNLDFTASDKAEYLRGVAFSYGDSNNLSYLFVNGNADSGSSSKKDKKLEDELQETMGDVDFNGLYTQYTILNNSKVDWAPEAVFDDGNKTYLRMPFRFSETPAFYISLDRRETMTNFRVKGRYYIVDRLFDKAYLKIGRKRVVLVRKDKLIDTNIRESRRTANPLSFREPEGR